MHGHTNNDARSHKYQLIERFTNCNKLFLNLYNLLCQVFYFLLYPRNQIVTEQINSKPSPFLHIVPFSQHTYGHRNWQLMFNEYKQIRKGKQVNQSYKRPEVPRGSQQVKVPRLRDNGPGWW